MAVNELNQFDVDPRDVVPAKPERLASLDAYRGFIMLVMASGGFGFPAMAKKFEHNEVWQFLGYQFDHVAWTGCAFWDLIQPSFMFMVGVAMPYSFARRAAVGQSEVHRFGHVLLRSLILIFLGIFLSSNGATQTDFTFVNVLTQIGLGYPFLYLLLGRGFATQLLAAAAVLVGYWLYFFFYPVPAAGFNFASVGLNDKWEHFTGLFAHWDKNTNAAAAFDQWFMNLFPRSKPFAFNGGGYQTLNFVPSLATMIFGLMAGELLRTGLQRREKLVRLAAAGAVCLAIGWAANEWLCPSVKRIWTPSWAVFSSGWTLLILAGFYGIIDVAGFRMWAFPLVVVGMNSIAMYCMSQLLRGWTRGTLKTHIGQSIFSGEYGPVVEAVSILFCLWLMCFWMYRQKFFVRI